tara:strand:- start:749 stop:943 length:195 start_codon:yes stop_codon:yes gene_type:complete
MTATNNPVVRSIFPQEVARVEMGKCPFCSKPVVASDFNDAVSLAEFSITGLCQNCQDEMFGTED